jgi:hypothetical protein
VVVSEPTRTPPTGDPVRPTLPGLSAVTGTKPRPEPLDPPMVPFAIGGLAAFAVAGLVLLLFRGRLEAHGHTDWLWICLAGFLVGLPGLATMVRHDAHRRQRRALSHPEFRQGRPELGQDTPQE